ncbi:hypothetical protein FOA52_008326 [Chlamydomonas sp. UWO 241]|nr:hypothetical protein FOA52_008326 [Chlamydomonas sp. UWO 241]
MLSLRSTTSSVVARRGAAPRAVVRVARMVTVVRSSPKEVDAAIEEALKAAKDCKEDCAASWDTVEELAAAKSHMKDAAKADPSLNDPLEVFCKDNADADECRVYED